MAQTNILDLTRQAFISYLWGFSGAANVYDEKNSTEKTSPSVSVGASRADEDPPLTGNFWVDVEVSVRTIAAIDATQAGGDPKAASDALATIVFEALEADNLKDLLSATADVTGYTVMGFAEEKTFTHEQDGDCWIQTWKRRVYCGRAGVAP
jgi:hypothetical protein